MPTTKKVMGALTSLSLSCCADQKATGNPTLVKYLAHDSLSAQKLSFHKNTVGFVRLFKKGTISPINTLNSYANPDWQLTSLKGKLV